MTENGEARARHDRGKRQDVDIIRPQQAIPLTEATPTPKFHAVPGVPRWVWAPEVHQAFEERNFIYLISGSYNQGNHLIVALESLFERLGIQGASFNIIYGPYDVLVRVWLNLSRRQRLLRFLKSDADPALRVDSFLEFIGEGIRHETLTGATILTEAQVQSFADEVERVVAADRAEDWDADALAAFFELEHEGFLFRHVASPGVKFYMFFTARGGRRTQPSDLVLQRLQEYLRQDASLSGVTLMEGVGFCDFVLKAVISDYNSVLPVVEALQRVGEELRLQAWTQVVADYMLRTEGESIGADAERVPAALQQLIRKAPSSEVVRQRLLSLDAGEQAAVTQLYSEGKRQLGRLNELERFVEVLQWTLDGNRKNLNQTLSFLTSIEGDLRELIPRLIAAEEGPGAFPERVRTFIANHGPIPKTDVSIKDRSLLAGFDLARLLQMLRELANTNPTISLLLERNLGSRWDTGTRAIVDLRNDYAHSRLVDIMREGRFTESLGEILRNLLIAIQFQVGLEILLKVLLESRRARQVDDESSEEA